MPNAALSASAVQPSGTRAAGMIAAAITAAVQRSGTRGCTEFMAQASCDHPGAAARRMRWARRLTAWPAARHQPPVSRPGRARPRPGYPPPIHLSVWSTTMPAPARSPRSRPHGAPAYYLARPASMWIAASGCRCVPPARVLQEGYCACR